LKVAFRKAELNLKGEVLEALPSYGMGDIIGCSPGAFSARSQNDIKIP
jgi:hypothetical protein